ncbi:hypothetical protein CF095_01110 [Clostridium botulinum]|uniref:hypothetical protein n=1 Tax=Clostridium botulinum TaxID=1491 RepID=UPI000773A903|nr:hypothetical protein [Clostridium botulinum]
MKKRNNLIIVCLALIIIAGSGIVYKNYFTNIDSNSYLSSKDESERSIFCHEDDKSSKNTHSFDFKRFNGKWSLMEFTSSKGNKININDNTKINKGKFYIVILDSQYNIIAKKNESNQNGNINFTTPKDGKYLIRIVGAKASGKFDVSVNSDRNIDISHIDFFD